MSRIWTNEQKKQFTDTFAELAMQDPSQSISALLRAAQDEVFDQDQHIRIVGPSNLLVRIDGDELDVLKQWYANAGGDVKRLKLSDGTPVVAQKTPEPESEEPAPEQTPAIEPESSEASEPADPDQWLKGKLAESMQMLNEHREGSAEREYLNVWAQPEFSSEPGPSPEPAAEVQEDLVEPAQPESEQPELQGDDPKLDEEEVLTTSPGELHDYVAQEMPSMLEEVQANVVEYVEKELTGALAEVLADQLVFSLKDLRHNLVSQATDIALARLVGGKPNYKPTSSHNPVVVTQATQEQQAVMQPTSAPRVSVPLPTIVPMTQVQEDAGDQDTEYFTPEPAELSAVATPEVLPAQVIVYLAEHRFRAKIRGEDIQVQYVTFEKDVSPWANKHRYLIQDVLDTTTLETSLTDKFGGYHQVRNSFELAEYIDQMQSARSAKRSRELYNSQFAILGRTTDRIVQLKAGERRPLKGLSIAREFGSHNGHLLENRLVLRHNGQFIDADYTLDRLIERAQANYIIPSVM